MTLELGLSGVPMVVAYRVSKIEEVLKYLIKAPSIVLTNLVLGENVIPELIQWDCTPEKLADALLPLLSDTPERQTTDRGFPQARRADEDRRRDAERAGGADRGRCARSRTRLKIAEVHHTSSPALCR